MKEAKTFTEEDFKILVNTLIDKFYPLVGFHLNEISPSGKSSNFKSFSLKSAQTVLDTYRKVISESKVDSAYSRGILISSFLPLDIFVCFDNPKQSFFFIKVNAKFSSQKGFSYSINDISFEVCNEEEIFITNGFQDILDNNECPEALKFFLVQNINLLS
jgi:hypothetical protein